MIRVKPKMTHNDRFFFSPFRVGLSQELALSRRNMKERFHSFKWHRKILFYVHSNFIPAARGFFSSSSASSSFLAREFYVLPLYF